MRKYTCRAAAIMAGLSLLLAGPAWAAPSHYETLAGIPFPDGYPGEADITRLEDEIFFQRAVQSYIWAIRVINILGMKEGMSNIFGEGYNLMIIWKDRLNAKTLITTPNSDVIYGLAFLDLKKDGPLVVEVPPGVQGIFDDFFQRPICSDGQISGKTWCGDVGLPGPDQGKGGKYLLLPPDYKDKVPAGYLPYRSKTYGVMVLWRGFFKDPKELKEPVENMERTLIYPLGKKESAAAMKFPNASQTPADMLYPKDGRAFDLLAGFIDREYVDPVDMEMRGMLAAVGIIKGQAFKPGQKQREMNVFPGNADFTADTFNFIDPRTGFFTNAFTASPGMALSMEKVGAKYPTTFVDADGKFLNGSNSYKVNLPRDIPAALFWSLTIYDSANASQVDNGQPFPSINSMDKPQANQDGSVDVYFGPDSPGEGNNWIKTLPDKGYFVILRLYGPTKTFFDKTWKPSDLERRWTLIQEV